MQARHERLATAADDARILLAESAVSSLHDPLLIRETVMKAGKPAEGPVAALVTLIVLLAEGPLALFAVGGMGRMVR